MVYVVAMVFLYKTHLFLSILLILVLLLQVFTHSLAAHCDRKSGQKCFGSAGRVFCNPACCIRSDVFISND